MSAQTVLFHLLLQGYARDAERFRGARDVALMVRKDLADIARFERRSRFACIANEISPLSSRKIVPPVAALKSPG